MTKPSIAELLTASGVKSFDIPVVIRASYSLYGNIGANLDERDWSRIMASSDPLAASEDALKVMYQDRGYLVRNTEHLTQMGYVPAQAELTYRQMAVRLEFQYNSAWSSGTANDYLGGRTTDQLIALIPVPPLPTVSIAATANGFAVTLSVAGQLRMSVSGEIGRYAQGVTELTEQVQISQGYLSLSGTGGTSESTPQYVVLGTMGSDLIDTRSAGSRIDYVLGSGGGDFIWTGVGDDIVFGGAGPDRITGGDGNDIIDGGQDNDFLNGDTGNDVFRYTDNLQLRGDALVSGGADTDTIAFSVAIDTLTPGSLQGDNFHADFVRARSIERIVLTGANQINLGDVFAVMGLTTIVTGTENTTLRYDAIQIGTVTIDATALVDGKVLSLTQFGSPGAGQWFDVVNLQGDVDAAGLEGGIAVTAAAGTGFAITVTGGNGDDILRGGAGNDVLAGGSGTDRLLGNGGNDIFIMAEDTPGGERINGGSTANNEVNTIRIDATSNLTNLLAMSADGSVDTLPALLSDGAINQVVLNGNSAGVTFYGEFIAGQAINFATVNDTDTSALVINVSAGLSLDFSKLTFLDDFGGTGFYGFDAATNPITYHVVGGAAAVGIVGSSLDDTINGGAGADVLTGGRGADSIAVGADSEADTVRANEGDGQLLSAGEIAHLASDRIDQFDADHDQFAVSGAGSSVILASAAAAQTAGSTFQDVASSAFDLDGSIGGAYITGAAVTNLRNFSDVQSAIGALGHESVGEEAYFVLRDGGGFGNAGIYHFHSVTANGQVDVGEIELLGLILTSGDLSQLSASNFVFA